MITFSLPSSSLSIPPNEAFMKLHAAPSTIAPHRQPAQFTQPGRSGHTRATAIRWLGKLGRFCVGLLAILALLVYVLSLLATSARAQSPVQAEVKNISLTGGLTDEKARLVIEADLKGVGGERVQPIFASAIEQTIHVSLDKLAHSVRLSLEVIQGQPKEFAFNLSGEGRVLNVTGDQLQDWSLREQAGIGRQLVLRPKKSDTPVTNFVFTVTAETELKTLPQTLTPLAFASAQPALSHGYVVLDAEAGVNLEVPNATGAVPVETRFLPENLRPKQAASETLAFRFQGSTYALPLTISSADPDARRIVLRDFKLTGRFEADRAAFTLTATARVKNPEGARLDLLSGGAALTGFTTGPDARVRIDGGRFVLVCDKPGEFPIEVRFDAAVRRSNEWNAISFNVAPSALQPVVLQGLAADTEFEFSGAAQPERRGNDFTSFLPADGAVRLSWKVARAEEQGKLFFSTEMFSQLSISSGLMRQTALFEGKVMQGELTSIALLLRGEDEITRVQGEQVLSWKAEPVAGSPDRRLVVQFNQPQRDRFSLLVHLQRPLSAFPLAMSALQIRPEKATRTAGWFRIVNEGAVRLEVVEASGLSQISPEQFPETETTKAFLRPTGDQRFAYRFSGADFTLRVQADNILPEVSVSQVLAYHLGETELAIEAELELDIREAPVREVLLRVPRGYALARLNASGLSDSFLQDVPDGTDAELRIVYGSPMLGRQVVQVRLEKNESQRGESWVLPRLEVVKAKSTRGNVGVSADPGFRLTPESTSGLTEIATAFFPKKLPGIQAGFRISEPAWRATLRIERLPQSVQADGFHLFSIGEGIAYGSSTMNFLVTGAPIASFRVELSKEYFNVEFAGKDLRNVQKTTNGNVIQYVVQLHTPVSGAYTLLATYERPFKAAGDTLTFIGARPLDAQTEQGLTIVVSAYQFQVKPVDVSPGLLRLETAEVPAEYRLFFDAPILAAYRYNSPSFNLQLALSPLAQGETVSLVVDRATLATRISKEGQVLTDARYFVKNRGNPNLRLVLPAGVSLWSATVNGNPVVPVTDKEANLIPLPQRADPNAVMQLDFKLASRSMEPTRVTVAAPILTAPVMLAEWKLEPDQGQRLLYRQGSLTPAGGLPDVSGFGGLVRLFSGPQSRSALVLLLAALALLGASLAAWRWATGDGVCRFSPQHLVGGGLGLLTFLLLAGALWQTATLAGYQDCPVPTNLTLLAPVQQPNSALTVELDNVAVTTRVVPLTGSVLLAVLALVTWIAGAVTGRSWLKPVGWTLAAWAVLRLQDNAPNFFGLLLLFVGLQVLVPALRRWFTAPQWPPADSVDQGGTPLAATMTALLLAGTCLSQAADGPATPVSARLQRETPVAEFVNQQIRVGEDSASATVRLRWHAYKGQLLPLLYEPAVLTGIRYPTNGLKLVQQPMAAARGYALLAQETGTFDLEFTYETALGKAKDGAGFNLRTQPGLVNEVTATVLGRDVDITHRAAVSLERRYEGSNTVARLIYAPTLEAWFGWKPRSRDARTEKAVFFAEVYHLYVPSAGIIEGLHHIMLRPAQGELTELVLDVPGGMTITDVLDPVSTTPADAKAAPPASRVSLWRFDPDTRKLRINLSPAQSKPFALVVHSQVATGPLPFEKTIGLIGVSGASGQIGLLGVATGAEVQLDSVEGKGVSAINLEDYPASLAQSLQGQFPGLALRRAFRYTTTEASAVIKASPVEADIRVTTQETLSLGEDRTVLAVNATVEVTRAGIFRLSFVLPGGLEVETVSGTALSHWTELKTEAGRVITLHLKGKTEGQQTFAVTLAGPGLKSVKGWALPQFKFREATKQQGQLVVVPEQGMRLQVATMDGTTQLDPQKAGIRQKGVLAFRLLQNQWRVTLDLEQVDAWVQATSLQNFNLTEAQVKVAANLQYQIENTGLKALRVLLPTNAESVRFTGEQVSDFLKADNAITDGLQAWDVKLGRRVIGRYLLQVNYQLRVPEQAAQATLQGIRAEDVNLQRGFVTLQSSGRLQVRVDATPAALQPTEWQSIPRSLQQDLPATAANYAFRLVEPAFTLLVTLERRDAAKLLPAQVKNITLTSVVSDEGAMLTQARLEMIPGDKRLLKLALPADARFWFAFVNNAGVWPWLETNMILIPLEQDLRSDKPYTVELFFSSQIGKPAARSLDLQLVGPKFDLPLENITWRVFLNDKWQLKDWSGTLQLSADTAVQQPVALDVSSYLQGETVRNQQQTKQAEQWLDLGNNLLSSGDNGQARAAFNNAYGMSVNDSAFNEDARVQLHNLKMQQALIGLNARQSTLGAESGAANKVRELQKGKGVQNYSQADAKQIIEANQADDNAAMMKVAERLVQQQDAAVARPAAIRATIPEQGRLLTFKRSVQVDPMADMRINLEARAARTASFSSKLLILIGCFALAGIIGAVARRKEAQ
jgi:hypothetical protein